jgi:hypothetical protein
LPKIAETVMIWTTRDCGIRLNKVGIF